MAPPTLRLQTCSAALLTIMAVSATPALAHPLVPGVTGYPALMLHPLLITHQALALFTAMLLMARSPALSRWRTALIFAAALAMAHIAQGFLPGLFSYYWLVASALITAAAGLVAALDPVPPRLALPAIALLGALIGLDTHGEAAGLWPRIEAVSAAMLTGVMLLMLAGFLGGYPLAKPLRLLARILAAWIAAATIMVLAFALRS